MMNITAFHRRHRRQGIFLVLLAASTSLPVVANDDIHFGGFISQGIQQAELTNFVNNEGDVSLALTEIGVNARWQLDDRFSVNGQLVYLNMGNRYPEGVRVDYLFVDWHAIRDTNFNLNVHLGRYKNYHWMYSATRDVPHTRPNNVLPQSIYFDSFRDVALGSDGVAIRANSSNPFGDWEFNWSYGSSPIDQASTQQLLGPTAKGKLEQDFVHQASTYWHSPDSEWMLGVNFLESDFSYMQAVDDPFDNGGATVQRVSLVGQYQSEYWELTSELMIERSIYNDVLFEGFSNDSKADGGYVQLAWFPRKQLDLLVRLDLYDLNRKDRNGETLPITSNGAIPNYFGFMDTATFGAKYQLHENLQLQAEFNRVRGAGRLTPLLLRDASTASSEYWNMWSVQLMYWF